LFFFLRVRSLKLSTARILVSHGADPNLANNRGETPMSIAEYLQTDEKQSFINVLIRKYNRKENVFIQFIRLNKTIPHPISI
jgi:hypothetical protein